MLFDKIIISVNEKRAQTKKEVSTVCQDFQKETIYGAASSKKNIACNLVTCEQKKLQCSNCNIKFKIYGNMKGHMEKKHGD